VNKNEYFTGMDIALLQTVGMCSYFSLLLAATMWICPAVVLLLLDQP
jgi:hypothetical protein